MAIVFKFIIKNHYHGCDGLLAGVITGGGIVPDDLSILDVHTLSNAVDLRYEGKCFKMFSAEKKKLIVDGWRLHQPSC